MQKFKSRKATCLHAVLLHPRPTYGICVAITVIVSTLALSGRPAM
jgi:hypothetical protein